MDLTPKGWRPDYTYTGLIGIGRSPHTKFDDRPSNNPYPKNMPNHNAPVGMEIMHIVRAQRKYKHMIHQDIILFESGDHSVLPGLKRNIKCLRMIEEELIGGYYELPKRLQWFLDYDNTEDAYV